MTNQTYMQQMKNKKKHLLLKSSPKGQLAAVTEKNHGDMSMREDWQRVYKAHQMKDRVTWVEYDKKK